MLDNLIFSLNSTMPIFLLMVLGYLLNKIGWMDDEFAAKANRFVFKVSLSAMLFADLAVEDFVYVWDARFVFYCFGVSLLSILIAWGFSLLIRDTDIRGEFVQGAYRSSAAILGIAFIQNIYGTSGMAPLMILGSVPLYNVMAVLVLTFLGPKKTDDSKISWGKTIKGIVTNPIIVSIVLGMMWSLLKLPLPGILYKTITNVGKTATPLGLMSMGASFRFGDVLKKLKPVVGASILKLVGFTSLFLPLAIMFGFREEKLIAILVMLGSSSTVAGYVMAKNMGHEGHVASGTVMLTTLFSAFTLTGWLFILKTLGYI